MSSQLLDRQGNLHATDTGRFTEHALDEADLALFNLEPPTVPEPEPLVVTAKPLLVKPGKPLVADAGRGLEEFTVLSATEVNGTRFVQDGEGQLWELLFKDSGCQVVSDPDLLAARTRMVSQAHRVGVVQRTDYRRPSPFMSGLSHHRNLHLASCPKLHEPSGTGFEHTIVDQAPGGPTSFWIDKAIEAHRADPDALCECLQGRDRAEPSTFAA